jgi:hypothetical protein
MGTCAVIAAAAVSVAGATPARVSCALPLWLIAAMAVTSLALGADTEREPWQRHTTEGIQLRETGHYVEAEALLRQALDEASRDDGKAIVLEISARY